MDELNLVVNEPKLNPSFHSKEKKKTENFTIADIAESISGYAHFNRIDTFEFIYANKKYENYFGLSNGEIIHHNVQFFREHYWPSTWEETTREIIRFGKEQNELNVFGHIQRIRKNKNAPYRNFVCSTRICRNPDCFITDYVPVDVFFNESKKIQVLADSIEFVLHNFTKYTLLSKRELEILRLIGCGKTRNEIAEELFISKHTLDNHRKHIRQKLEINTTAELFRYIHAFDLF